MKTDEKNVSKSYYKLVKLVAAEFKKSTNWSNNPGWDLTFEDEDFVYSHFQISPDFLWKQNKKAAYTEAKKFMTKLCSDGRNPQKDVGNWYKVKVVARNMSYNDSEHIMYNVESIIRKVDEPIDTKTITEKEAAEEWNSKRPEPANPDLPIRKVKVTDPFNFNQNLAIFMQNF